MAELLKYNVSDSIYFPLIDRGTVDFENTPVTFAAADTKISKDGAAFANSTNLPTHIGGGIYKLVLTAAELSAKKIIVKLVDAATKAFEDQAILIDTYGNASGQHAFDLNQAIQPVNVTQLGGVVQSLTDLKDFTDNGYDPATKKVEGVKLNDTTTTNTDMRGTDSAATAAGLATHDAKLVVVDGVVDAILIDTNDIQPKIGVPVVTIAADIASNNTAITGISNVTRLNQGIPTYHMRPAAGDKAVRWDFSLHDTNGNQEDPDGNQLAIKITNASGAVLNSRLFKENALSTVLDTGTGIFTAFVKLEKDTTGKYFAFIKVNAADAEEEIRIEIGWQEGSNELNQFSATQILDATNDLISIKNDTVAILGDSNEIQSKLPTNKIMGSSTVADKDDEIDAIKAKTDLLAFTAGNVHNHTKVQDDLALTAQQKLDVNAEVDTALDEKIPEPAQAKPDATNSIREVLGYVNQAQRNTMKVNKTTGFITFENDDGTVTHKKQLIDDGNEFEEREAVTGP